MRNRLIFITGGTRSGKSAYALNTASALDGEKVFLATAIAKDQEMRRRIEAHKNARPSGWSTIEEAEQLASAVKRCNGKHGVLLIDCLTLWTSYLMLEKGLSEDEVLHEMDELLDACRSIKGTVIIVSNEIGMGIVPMNELSRSFRDTAGRANQAVASMADEVYFVVAGIPITLKGSPVREN